jgi:hypothetical protein
MLHSFVRHMESDMLVSEMAKSKGEAAQRFCAESKGAEEAGRSRHLDVERAEASIWTLNIFSPCFRVQGVEC